MTKIDLWLRYKIQAFLFYLGIGLYQHIGLGLKPSRSSSGPIFTKVSSRSILQQLFFMTNLMDKDRLDDPHVEANLLFQAHFSQLGLRIRDYVQAVRYLKSVLDQSMLIIQAMMDICANSGWISSSITCMHLLQMVVQSQPVEGFYRSRGKLLEFDLPGGIPESWPKLLQALNLEDHEDKQSAAA